MDAEILRAFIEEAESYLPLILDGVIADGRDPAPLDGLKNALQLARKIKGAAQIIGLPEIGEIAARVSSELSAFVESGGRLGEEKAREICNEIMRLENALWQARQTLTPDAGRGETALPVSGDEFDADASNAGEADSFADFELDPETLEVFALEADEHLRNIAVHLERLEKNVNDRSALLEIRRSAHTLKGSAGIVGFAKLSALAHRLEDLLDFMAENEIGGDQNVFEVLLASTECLQALVGGRNSPELDDAIAAIYRRSDEILAALKARKTVVSRAPEPAPTEKDPASPAFAAKRVESGETKQTAANNAHTRSVVRVSLDRLDDLARLAGEMVTTRAALEQRLRETEQQLQELRLAASRLRRSALRLEIDFEPHAPGGKGARAYDSVAPMPAEARRHAREFDALEFDNYTEFHETARALGEAASDTAAVNAELDRISGDFGLLFDQQRRLIEEMQDNLLCLRMLPLSSLAPRLQRTVRVTAHAEGKSAELVLENEDLEIETQILDSIVEPLLHLLKNAVAHGIETTAERRGAGKLERGRITLRAANEGTHVVFTVADDGRGISSGALKEKAVAQGFVAEAEAAAMPPEDANSLIFLPGLSTADKVTQISGRGVGMNAVKSDVLRRRGTIAVNSTPGKGTIFTVRLPASLALTRALLIEAAGQTYAFPLKLVKRIAEIPVAEAEAARAAKSVRLDGRDFRFARLNELLSVPPAEEIKRPVQLLLVEGAGAPCAVAVERIVKAEEIVVKPLGSLLAPLRAVIGASVLGDGKIAPVLDLVYLLKKEGSKNVARPIAPKSIAPIFVLVADDSPSVRQVMSKLLKNAGLETLTARDGLEALDVLQAARTLPAVILSDVEMPRMDGYALLAALKRQPNLRRIPVVMITSRAGDKHRRKALELGAADYLSKPFEEALLLKKIKALAEAGAV